MFGRSSRDPFWPPALGGRRRRVVPEPLVPRGPAAAPRDGLRTLAERAALERRERERAIAGHRERERERAAFENAARRRAELERAERERATEQRALEVRAEREMAARESAARERAERDRTDAQRVELERAQRERAEAASQAASEREAEERAALATREATLPDEIGASAEADAVRERRRREADRELEQARLDLARPLLPVLDNLDRTIEAARRDSAEGLLEGLTMVRSQFEGVLTSYGLERIASLGQPFDPSVHEAVATVAVDAPGDDGRVVDEWQRGYRAGGRVLRPAAVRVGRFARA